MAEQTGTFQSDQRAVPPVRTDVGLNGGRVRVLLEHFAVVAGWSQNDTAFVGRLPSKARILNSSKVEWDDIGAASATLDIGVFNPSGKSGITDDDDALTNGLAISSAGNGDLLSDFANSGKRLWEFVSGQTTDPNQDLEIIATVKDADVDGAGDLVVEVHYTID